MDLPLASLNGAEAEGRDGHGQKIEESGVLPHENCDLTGIKILAIDDQEDVRHLLKRVLDAAHAEVTVAASSDEGLQVLREFCPHVVLCDIGMPGKDGYQFLREMRSAGFDMPVVAVTAFARAEDRLRAVQAGYNAQVTQPINHSELTAAITSLLRTTSQSS